MASGRNSRRVRAANRSRHSCGRRVLTCACTMGGCCRRWRPRDAGSCWVRSYCWWLRSRRSWWYRLSVQADRVRRRLRRARRDPSSSSASPPSTSRQRCTIWTRSRFTASDTAAPVGPARLPRAYAGSRGRSSSRVERPRCYTRARWNRWSVVATACLSGAAVASAMRSV